VSATAPRAGQLLSSKEAEHAAERLLDAPTTLGEPYSRHLGDGLRELRFGLGHDGNAIRLTYWLTQNRRIVLLTVFRKTRMREDAAPTIDTVVVGKGRDYMWIGAVDGLRINQNVYDFEAGDVRTRRS
jgi:hypothetical protein